MSRPLARALSTTARAAAAPRGNPHLLLPADSKLDVIKAALYPSDAVAPASASPTGARHPQHAARLEKAVPSAEAYETLERAWALFRRRERAAREGALQAKFAAMRAACDELKLVAENMANTAVYDKAMVRMAHSSAALKAAQQGLAQGKKKTAESRFIEARPAGMVPREQWVPTETRGKGWAYDWERPRNEW